MKQVEVEAKVELNLNLLLVLNLNLNLNLKLEGGSQKEKRPTSLRRDALSFCLVPKTGIEPAHPFEY